MDTPEAGYNQCSIGTVFFRVSSRQILACPGMNGLLAGPLNDAAGLDAVPADLASVVQQVLPPPPRVSLRISHIHKVPAAGRCAGRMAWSRASHAPAST
jgi:hypothetical protein